MKKIPTIILSVFMVSAAIVSCNGNDEYCFEEMKYSHSSTSFCLWSDNAESAVVHIYDSADAAEPLSTTELSRDENGYWRAKVKGDLMDKFYTFQITHKGKQLQETPGVSARAVGLNGKRAAIIDMSSTDPEGWDKDVRPELSGIDDIVIYELHHRDFTMDKESGVENKGGFLSYTEKGTVNSFGDKTGMDHLVEMGVTHVHILPSFDGAGDEVANAYNWGYDPLNYNVPEGKYSSDPANPYARIREFKQMVKAMHDNGIRVVLDVVYNHTASTGNSNFDLTSPDYYYRFRANGRHSDGSGCGNETASEKDMMRRYMVESVLWWVREYHIDGFRFDLMGVHDIETMNAIREALDKEDPSIFVYGEGWSAGTCMLETEKLAMKANIAAMPGISAFGDELRDAVRGPYNDEKKGAFLAGVAGNEESIKFGLVGAIEHKGVRMDQVNYSDKAWAMQPTQMISYASCHDDMCLSDRLRTNIPGDESAQLAALKLGQTIVLASQGIPFIFCGEELFRDKKMVGNSYRSPDSVNSIEWARKHEYRDVFDYVKEMISIRHAHKAFHMGDADLVRKNVDFLPVSQDNLVAMHINGAAVGDDWKDIYVVFNASRTESVEMDFPAGEYLVVCENGSADASGLTAFTGNQRTVGPTSALIIVRQ